MDAAVEAGSTTMAKHTIPEAESPCQHISRSEITDQPMEHMFKISGMTAAFQSQIIQQRQT
jgi:hypothetical protein